MHHAQRAQADALRLEQVRIVVGVALRQRAVRQDQLETSREGRQGAQRAAGAVSGGGEGASDRLAVDVALVGQGESLLPQGGGQAMDRHACRNPRIIVIGGDLDLALHVIQVEQQSVGRAKGHEGVTGAYDAHPGGVTHQALQLLEGARMGDRRRPRLHASRPVPPRRHRPLPTPPDHRKSPQIRASARRENGHYEIATNVTMIRRAR